MLAFPALSFDATNNELLAPFVGEYIAKLCQHSPDVRKLVLQECAGALGFVDIASK